MSKAITWLVRGFKSHLEVFLPSGSVCGNDLLRKECCECESHKERHLETQSTLLIRRSFDLIAKLVLKPV